MEVLDKLNAIVRQLTCASVDAFARRASLVCCRKFTSGVFILSFSLGFFSSSPAAAGLPPASADPYLYCFNGVNTPSCGFPAGTPQVPTQEIQDWINWMFAISPVGCAFKLTIQPWSPQGQTLISSNQGYTSEAEIYTLTNTNACGGPWSQQSTGLLRRRVWTCPPPSYIELGLISGFCSVGIGIALFDPVADNLLSSTGLVTDVGRLAAASHVVAGAAADSATQVLVQVSTPSPGDSIQLTLSDEQGPSGDGLGAGYLTPLPANGSDSRGSGGVITIQSVATSSGAIAFAVYHAPTDFVRASNTSDPTAATRTLIISASDTSGYTASQNVVVVRPPVVMVHGIWGSPSDFSASDGGVVGAFAGNVPWSISFARYDQTVGITATNPQYSGSPIIAKGNSLGFLYGATAILPTIKKAIAKYKEYSGVGYIAAVQADIVAHSMGGDIIRTLPQISGYSDQNTYYQGYVHKLITMDTPHRGSPLASALHAANQDNSCVRQTLAYVHRYPFLSATVNATAWNGGTGDLQATSGAINAIQTGAATIPTAMIGGKMTSQQLAGAGTGWGNVIATWCSSNPLGQKLTPQLWPVLMGGDSDAIVDLASQFDGNLAYSSSAPSPIGNTFGAVHSKATEDLGFAAPSILDRASSGPAKVINLLNTPVSNTAVFVVKP